MREGKRVNLSPRATEEAHEMLRDDELREHLRVYQARFKILAD